MFTPEGHTVDLVNIKTIYRDASDLGLPPGSFPKRIVFLNEAFGRGDVIRRDGELILVHYYHVDEKTGAVSRLTLFND